MKRGRIVIVTGAPGTGKTMVPTRCVAAFTIASDLIGRACQRDGVS